MIFCSLFVKVFLCISVGRCVIRVNTFLHCIYRDQTLCSASGLFLVISVLYICMYIPRICRKHVDVDHIRCVVHRCLCVGVMYTYILVAGELGIFLRCKQPHIVSTSYSVAVIILWINRNTSTHKHSRHTHAFMSKYRNVKMICVWLCCFCLL